MGDTAKPQLRFLDSVPASTNVVTLGLLSLLDQQPVALS